MRKRVFFLIAITWMATFTNGSVLQCTWNGEQCVDVISMDPIFTADEVITVAGKPANYINTVTTFLKLDKITIKYVPKNIFSVFKGLTSLMILNYGTATLTTDSYVNCLNLQAIWFFTGTIINVPEGFAQSCSNVTTVILRSSNIETIHVNAFQGLGKLGLLDIRNNKITCIPVNLFLPTPLIQIISMQENKIAGIDSGIFKNLANLQIIEMQNNLIKYLPTLTLPASSRQMLIGLFGNPIMAVKPDFCTTFNSRMESTADVIYFKDPTLNNTNGIPCLVPGIVFSKVTKADCASFSNAMSTCFANYNASMTSSYPCSPSSVCIPGATYAKIMDFFRSITAQIDAFLKSI